MLKTLATVAALLAATPAVAPQPKMFQATSIPITVANDKKELLQRVMTEFYGSYSKEHSCWTSNHGGTNYCMEPAHLDIVGNGANRKIFIAVGGLKLDKDGQPDDCHACPGALGLIVLAEGGSQFGVIAKNDLFEDFGSWGVAPGIDLAGDWPHWRVVATPDTPAVSVRELGPQGSYGWMIKTGYGNNGEQTDWVKIHGIVGDGIVSLGSVTTNYNNGAAGCGERGRPRCTDISGDLVIDANSPAGPFYPLVLRAWGTRQGRPFKGTYRFVFDRRALEYKAPRNMPDELSGP